MPIPTDVVQAVEAQYHLRVSAEEAASTDSALDLYRLLLRRLGLVPGQTIGISGCVFHRLRQAIMQQYGVERRRIRPSTRLGDVLPRGKRWPQVQALVEQIGVGFYMPDLPAAAEKSADNWAYGLVSVVVILPLLLLSAALGMATDSWLASGVVLALMVAIAYPAGKYIHGRLIRASLLKAAHLTDTGMLRQIVASCLGPRGDRLALYDWRLRWLWEDFTDVVAAQTGIHPMLLTANAALALDQHQRGVEPDQHTDSFAAVAYATAPRVQRECVAQVLAAYMRGELMSFDVWGLLFTLQASQHTELHPLATSLAHMVDTKQSYPITVSEEDWHYLRRMIAALRSGLPLKGYDFPGCDLRHRPPELALEPFWTAVQWQRCEPLLEDLDLPEFDPQTHSSPSAAVALRPRVEGTPRGVYRTVMVSEEARPETLAPPAP